ncbi:MAG: hypothetical protein LBS53_07195 [Synergistaceae bacterium]|jgi:L-fucose isomerase|nr:hypothetical protein [Synergistaceae bacterium]
MSLYEPKFALAIVADTRDDFYPQREWIVRDELQKIRWLHQNAQMLESPVLRSVEAINEFSKSVKNFGAQAMIILFPIWADPELSVQLQMQCRLPLLLFGNGRPDSSSAVGLLGAGGALDQAGLTHARIFSDTEENRRTIKAFLRAAATAENLRGNRALRFGGRSLGIMTAEPNELELIKRFGVTTNIVDQNEIITQARLIPRNIVEHHMNWIIQKTEIVFDEIFTADTLEKQVRAYIAAKLLSESYHADLIGIKCQRELSDGYVVQCLTHLLLNGTEDADGKKNPLVCACESDTNGALTMRILHLLSNGQPAALMDVRTLDSKTGKLILANCGAIPEDMMREPDAPVLSGCGMRRHIFGKGGGGGFSGTLRRGEVTMARLCIRNQKYWMAVSKGVSADVPDEDRDMIPRTFPSAMVNSSFDDSFLREFGSNHLHIVFGDYTEEVRQLCSLLEIECRVW